MPAVSAIGLREAGVSRFLFKTKSVWQDINIPRGNHIRSYTPRSFLHGDRMVQRVDTGFSSAYMGLVGHPPVVECSRDVDV